MTATAVITAIYGGRDQLRTPAIVHSEVDYICFTDHRRLKHDVWECRYVAPSHVDPCRSAKRFKILAHLFVDHARSIWLDANCRLLCDPTTIWSEFSEPLGLIDHWRDCLYHEARECRKRAKDDPAIIEETANAYRQQEHPPHWGLWYGGFSSGVTRAKLPVSTRPGGHRSNVTAAGTN